MTFVYMGELPLYYRNLSKHLKVFFLYKLHSCSVSCAYYHIVSRYLVSLLYSDGCQTKRAKCLSDQISSYFGVLLLLSVFQVEQFLPHSFIDMIFLGYRYGSVSGCYFILYVLIFQVYLKHVLSIHFSETMKFSYETCTINSFQ